MREATIRIGTSGWHYRHWKGNFYPADISPSAMLRWYMQRLDTVEINNSFYRLPSPEAVNSWVQQTPANFLFAVKASRYITHNCKLKNPQQCSSKFFDVVQCFGKKLGPILFQLPAIWSVNVERLTEFLAALPRTHRYAFEFRNPTWHIPAVYKALSRFNAAFCIFEIGGFQSPPEVTADFVYVRLHGPGQAYQGSYSGAALRNWAKRITSWRATGHDTFLYFDNDQAGFAAQNAMDLAAMACSRPALSA